MSGAVDPRTEAVRRLPAVYALAIRLRDAGMSDAVIADRLGIDEVALGPLLRVAEAKLETMIGRPTTE